MIIIKGDAGYENQIITFLALSVFAIGILTPAGAHCDALDGPVVKAAQKSLDTGNGTLP